MISTRTDISERAWELFDGLCQGSLSAAEVRELEALLSGNTLRQRALLDYCRLHTDLKTIAVARRATQQVQASIRRSRYYDLFRWSLADWAPPARSVPALLRRCGRVVPDSEVAVGGLVLLAVAAAFWGIITLGTALLNDVQEARHARQVAGKNPSAPIPDLLPPIREPQEPVEPMDDGCSVTLTRLVGNWSETGIRWKVGDRLPVGDLVLANGTAELTFDSGATVALEGPCAFRIDGSNASALRLGKLLAQVPPQAVGFKVKAPQTNVIDLGTEFGMEVRPNGVAEVHVLEGRVQLQPKGSQMPAQVLMKSEAVVMAADGTIQYRGQAQPSLFRRTAGSSRLKLEEVEVAAYRYLSHIRPAPEAHRNDDALTKLSDGQVSSFDELDSRWIGFHDPRGLGGDDGSPQPAIRFELPSLSTIDAVRIDYMVMPSAAVLAPNALRIRAASKESELDTAPWQTLIGFDKRPNIAGLSGKGSGSVKTVTLDTARLLGRWVDLEFVNSGEWTYLTEITFLRTKESQ